VWRANQLLVNGSTRTLSLNTTPSLASKGRRTRYGVPEGRSRANSTLSLPALPKSGVPDEGRGCFANETGLCDGGPGTQAESLPVLAPVAYGLLNQFPRLNVAPLIIDHFFYELSATEHPP
jgi:hypothetical protein